MRPFKSTGRPRPLNGFALFASTNMAKPPADADPEKFIIGHGVYGNLRTAQAYDDDRIFRLDPTPMPVISIIVYNAIFVLFFYAFHWVCRHIVREDVGAWMADYAPLCIGLLTCGVFTVVTYAAFERARRLGPWLVYDKRSRRLTLPRERVTFERSEIVRLQYITTKRLWWGSVANNDRLSELNVITRKNGERKRWPLLRSIANVKAFDWLLKPVVANTDLPVVRVTDEWLGWNVTERPYSGSAGE